LDFYTLLGVPLTASDAEIKHSFREKAKIYHPDINTSPEAGDNFRLIYIAYETLKDPFKRKLYDRLLQEDYVPTRQSFGRAYYEKMQRRADMRARQYAEMEYADFEESAFARATFHFKQSFAFLMFFLILCGGMIGLIMGFHYVFHENFNGAMVTGYGYWLGGIACCYVSGKALLEIFNIWRS